LPEPDNPVKITNGLARREVVKRDNKTDEKIRPDDLVSSLI
jgi:hypothetical protein